MTEMEEIKTMLADMNKKLDRVIFQNTIALHTKYGSPIKQETEESCCKKFREVKHEAVKEFAEKLKSELGNCTGCYIPNCFESPTDEFAYSEKDLLKLIYELLKEYEK